MRDEFMKIWSEFCVFRDSHISDLHSYDQRSKLILALWARINSLCEDTLVLIDNNRSVSLQILMRSSLESFVDLRCLLVDDNFAKSIYASEANSEYRHLSHYEPESPYYNHTSQPSTEKIEALRSEKKKALPIYDRFQKAGCAELYRTVYNNLCRHAHGNVSALASKNFENDKIVLNTKIGQEDLLFVLSSTINIALSSTVDVLEFYKVSQQEKDKCLSMHSQVKALCEKFV
ncbi:MULTISPECIES: DUF5677 domain-containing protein [Vibrio]|uniref:DUF5677 domain-containing protein n=1 Tax=Vibrio TaxID=662 RepID=UPI00038E23F8|nr:DUF5677 domain-containing protein [Vibrio parahaemolyticus]ANQ55831.1 hypothetical protein AB831_06475 [Vibrio parahaemolyticus]ASO15698.1 hypothetical protein BGM07_015630 [Vibrio parahaemolyticus]AWA89785.1 hypothetical protein BSG32_12385 [Vibrio parahaemolyticus]EGQ7714866.1 hypothetical protein [Vibrio parahaemolyticus]EGQ7720909.1 hypothetical protein [Vibrio parahaemolyticus]